MAIININISIEVADDNAKELMRRFPALEEGIAEAIDSPRVRGLGEKAIDIDAWEITTPRVEVEAVS